MLDERCRCPVLDYLTTRVPDSPGSGRFEHLYRCRKCGWTTPSPEYKGRRINKEEESRE